MATGATRSPHLTVVNTNPERNHICRRPFWYGKVFGVTLWRLGGRLNDFASRGGNARARSSLRRSAGGITSVDDPINSSVNVLRDVERPVRPDRKSCRTIGSTFRSLLCSGKAVGEYLARARRLVAVEGLENYVVATLRVRRPIP